MPSLAGERLWPQFPPTFSITSNTTQPHGPTDSAAVPPNHDPSVAQWESQLAQLEHQPGHGGWCWCGYSLQNFWKSACSSLRALRKTRPFSVPTTKALSSWMAMQATSAFSLESAKHCWRHQVSTAQDGGASLLPTPCHFPVGFFSSHQKILPSKAVFWFMSEFHGFMTSLKSFGDFTALQKYPAGKQELLTHHFISLFPILKRNILLHFFKRKHSCKKKSNEKTTPQLITICVFPPALME